MESVFELEKKILKAQSPEEIDEITRKRKLKGYKPKISDAWFRYEGVVYDRNI